MKANELRKKYIEFFVKHGHKEIKGANLVPENDPSVLFTTAGMHPLVPYLLGEQHPSGKRLVNYQKCIRTGDIMDVGDGSHLTFFEMMGNWSLGDYFKEEAIKMSYEFLMSSEYLGLDLDTFYVTCFEGDNDCPRDNEAFEIWRSLGIKEDHITFLPKKDNWWGPAGTTGPCGPDTEMFIDLDPSRPKHENPGNSKGRFLEIWNDVFMQYDKQADGSFIPLKQKNVDTGLGLERVTAVLQGKKSAYDTEIFAPILEAIKLKAQIQKDHPTFVIADHIRASSLMIAEGLRPGNVDQPYILRRLIRRMVRMGRELGIQGNFVANISESFIPTLSDFYPELIKEKQNILSALDEEESKFKRTLDKGEKEFERAVEETKKNGKTTIDGVAVFHLYDTFGFPSEMTEELAEKEGLAIDKAGFEKAFEEHQEKSRAGAEARFKGGLSERSPETTKLHTATHLLHKALKQVLGDHVAQKGSNITPERLRFDFSHPQKMTKEEVTKVEEIVNEQISRGLEISCVEMTVEEAKNQGAIGLFESKYGELVKVYTMGDFSKEICGGPHVENTKELVKFKIQKEEASSSGVRRIRAVLINQ